MSILTAWMKKLKNKWNWLSGNHKCLDIYTAPSSEPLSEGTIPSIPLLERNPYQITGSIFNFMVCRYCECLYKVYKNTTKITVDLDLIERNSMRITHVTDIVTKMKKKLRRIPVPKSKRKRIKRRKRYVLSK